MRIKNKTLSFILLVCMLLSLVPITAFATDEGFDLSKKDGSYRANFIPSVIEAENYDVGADGSKSAAGVVKNTYREDGQVVVAETTAGSGKYHIELKKNEFVRYTIEADYDGIYDLYLNLNTVGEVYITVDGNETPLKAAAYEKAGRAFAGSLFLRKGTHTLKLISTATVKLDSLVIESSSATGSYFDPTEDYGEPEEEVAVRNEVYKEFYVSLSGSDENDGGKGNPFKTLNRAQEEVRKFNKNMTGDIYVYIEPGYHKLDETLKFSADDGGMGKYNVVYKGTNPFSESVIGGGNLITGWKKTENELYRAYYDSPNDFRNLYINDVPAVRAMTKYFYKPTEYFKNDGSEYSYDGMKFEARNFPDGINDINRVEAVWDIEWVNHRLPIKSLEYVGKEAVMQMEQPWFNSLALNKNTSPVKKGSSLYFENDMAFLDEPGEFYYDMKNKAVYYYPREGEKLENVYACDTEILINAEGTKENPVRNLHFERLSFKHGAFYETNEGYNHGQALTISRPGVATKPLPAQLEFKHVTGMKLKNCKLIGLGSAAVGITNGVTNSEISGNLFREISGHAILAGWQKHLDKMPEGHLRVSDILIKNNVIRRAGREFRDCPAIHLFYVKDFTIIHNDIEETCYTGISVGWGWGEDVKASGGHTIAYNRVVDVMGPTHDGAHIYTLSPVRDTKIFRNYFKDTNDYRGGIYFDNGSAYMEAYENVCAVSGNWIWARENAGLSNLKAYNNWHYSEEERIDPKAVTAYGNKLEKDGAKGVWSAEAQAVIDNAGVGSAYKGLIKESELPDYAKGYMRDLPKGTYVARNDWISPGTYVNFLDLDAGKPGLYANGNIGNTVEGEWCEYSVVIPESGDYKFTIKAGNGNKAQEPKVKLSIDGKVVNDNIPVPMWKENKWTTGEIDGGEYHLEKGTHRVRIEHKDGNFMFGPFKFAKGDVLVASDPEYDEGKLPSEMAIKGELVFTDLKNHWSAAEVMELYNAGLVKGVTETMFAPQREITLYETVLLAVRVSGVSEELWKEKLTELGMEAYIKNADSYVSREIFCDIIMKFYADKKGNYTAVADYDAFGDLKSIDIRLLPCVWGAKTLGLVKGDDMGNFNPKKSLTRAEAAAIVLRYFSLIK